jgi:hypothetical protein
VTLYCLYVNNWLKDTPANTSLCSLLMLLCGTRKPSRVVHVYVCNETYKYKCTTGRTGGLVRLRSQGTLASLSIFLLVCPSNAIGDEDR